MARAVASRRLLDCALRPLHVLWLPHHPITTTTTRENELDEADPLPPRAVVTITITYDQITGAVNVAGLPTNKIIGFGLMQLAILVAQEAYNAQERSALVPARSINHLQLHT